MGFVENVNNAETNAAESAASEWEAKASELTAISYATEAEDTEVNIVTSDGDGTYTSTPQTGVYSALHYEAKSVASATAAGDSETAAELSEWEAHASKLTALSYATEAEDTEVNLVTSDGDGTYTSTTQTGVYSALHWAAKSATFNPVLYALLTGATFTGNVLGITPTLAAHLTRKDYVDTALALKAPLSSPSLTGTPTAPTAPNGTNTTQLATTAFAYGVRSASSNGYIKLPNGLIIQWGTVGIRSNSPVSTTRVTNFPIAFPTNCLYVQSSHDADEPTAVSPVYTSSASSWTTTGFTEYYTMGRTAWLAIGH